MQHIFGHNHIGNRVCGGDGPVLFSFHQQNGGQCLNESREQREHRTDDASWLLLIFAFHIERRVYGGWRVFSFN